MTHNALVWLRNDLRLDDNPALDAALVMGGSVFAVYIHELGSATRPNGGAAGWWLDYSLHDLAQTLAKKSVTLLVETGDPADILDRLIGQYAINSVFWNRRYAVAEREYDATLKSELKERGIKVASFRGNLLVEPWEVTTGAGGNYQVFTPYAKAVRQNGVSYPLPFAEPNHAEHTQQTYTVPSQPAWAHKMGQYWQIGEAGARQRLAKFYDELIGTYSNDRDRPEIDGTSALSPYLRFGEISVRRIWHDTLRLIDEHPELSEGGEKFLSELIWRDFSYHQLYHRPDIAAHDMRPTLAPIRWRNGGTEFTAWTKGQTGIPIVDAGMRQLWETGWMHNRVRMLVASFLTKNLLTDWRQGEAWFWDTLVDADQASNPASWQWVAGCGMDAAPYFRVFNPVVQGKRFDADGAYVRRWVPELAKLPAKWIHSPAEAPDMVLIQAGIKLGSTYPLPIADLATSQRFFKQVMKEDSAFE